MDVVQKEPETETRHEAAAELAELLRPGVLVVEGGRNGGVAFADPRAMDLLGCADRAALDRQWAGLRSRLEGGGRSHRNDRNDLETGGRRLILDWRPNDHPKGGGVLLVHDAAVAESLQADLRH